MYSQALYEMNKKYLKVYFVQNTAKFTKEFFLIHLFDIVISLDFSHGPTHDLSPTIKAPLV